MAKHCAAAVGDGPFLISVISVDSKSFRNEAPQRIHFCSGNLKRILNSPLRPRFSPPVCNAAKRCVVLPFHSSHRCSLLSCIHSSPRRSAHHASLFRMGAMLHTNASHPVQHQRSAVGQRVDGSKEVAVCAASRTTLDLLWSALPVVSHFWSRFSDFTTLDKALRKECARVAGD